MQAVVILSKLEQEYLLRAIESALCVADPRQFYLWTQGQVQALLPHQVMVCLQFDQADQLVRSECLHSCVLDEAAMARLCDPHHGLALRVARHCRAGSGQPCTLDIGDLAPGAPASFQHDLRQLGYDNLAAHGSERLAGASTFFVLLGLPLRPGARHAYFLELLLPYLHMALLRLSVAARPRAELGRSHALIARPVSAREAEILHWVREGKSNLEIGIILGISGLTVKNHLQRIYKALGVCNRAQAIARCMALRLFEAGAAA